MPIISTPRENLQVKLKRYIDITDLSLNTSEEWTQKKFIENYIKIDEGALEFLPDVGFKKKFANIEEIKEYISKKFTGNILEVKEVTYTENNMFLKKDIVIYIQGEEIARLKSS